ncbi:hypothetical protein [Amycolatopsis sp. WQ 127309]|uniref:hypothetical protein n=1 Tax=Amycolatopsis sp. WQ 127309 TaxID=2932773 RepID=UPI001FF3284F|nr:hypothetical protein [Amycolatopsis sp. WQ 127309]UOZ10920.1 hypothetical protein MUY22_22675 [Amycolatopsis sp. WQ 127309]
MKWLSWCVHSPFALKVETAVVQREPRCTTLARHRAFAVAVKAAGCSASSAARRTRTHEAGSCGRSGRDGSSNGLVPSGLRRPSRSSSSLAGTSVVMPSRSVRLPATQ